jgi:GAF domain-containing protein/DNA-binding NarL/FixJ family response regulator
LLQERRKLLQGRQTEKFQAIYQEIVATAIALTRADAGSIQILDEATQELVMLANQGVGQKLTEHFHRVNAGSNTPCGMALRTGTRTFVDFDVPESEDPHGSMRLHREEGYLSAQSTPLIARSGKAIGMVSTHWCKHHRPSDRELRFLDLLARQAADLIEQRQAQAALRESEARLALELADAKQLQFISSQLLQEENINVLYEQILEAAIAIMRSEMGSMQMLHPDSNQLQLLAWKGFDPASAAFWEWVQVDSETPCGMALNTGERAIIPDVETWEFLTGSRDLDAFRLSGIRSVQTTPLISRSGRVVGMISTHWREPHQPSERELGLLDVLARQAADLIEQRQAEAASRQSEAKYRSLFESMDEGYILVDAIFDENDQPIDCLYLEANSAAVQMTGTELVGRRALEIDPNFESRWFETFGRVAKTGIGERHEFYTAPLDVWYDFYVFKVGEPNERRVAAVYQDVSDRKRTEEQLRRAAELDAFRVKLSDALRSLTDPVEIQAQACRLLGEHLNVDRAYYVEANEAEGYTRVNQNYLRGDSPSLVGIYQLADYDWTLPFLRRGEPVIVADAQTSDIIPEADREMMVAVKIAAHITSPLIKAGTLVGSLCVTESVPRQWSAAEVELVRETAERIWATIIRARAEADLRESEEKYRSLFESIDEGYLLAEVIFDENDKPIDILYLEANPAAIRLAGRDFSGQRMREIDPHYEDYWYEIYGGVALTGESVRAEHYAEPHGRWFDFYAFKVGGQESRRVAAVFRDVTDRKRTEEQLRRAAELDAFRVKLSDALRSLSDPVEIQQAAMRVLGEHLAADRVFYGEITDDGEMIVIADNYLRGDAPKLIGQLPTSAFGKASETLRAGHTFVFSDIDRDERLLDADREAIRALSIISSATVPLVKQSRWVSNLAVHYSKLHQWTDDEIQLLQETAERTWAAVERARAEAALRESEIQRIQEQSAREEERQRAESLAELDRAKTLFFSNVSHEFRTPLTLILAPVQDALSDSVNLLPGVQRERLELVHRNTMRLLKLVNTLLDFSRIEAGRMEAVYEPTDLAMFTAELASVFRSAIEQAGLRLVVDCPPMSEPVYVDRQMWEKIVLNLLSNAFKFTFLGEITVRLHLSDNYHVTLQVEDTGAGIEPEELPHLFERFYQVRKAKARTHEGSGIGLALVQELIKLHGGTVDVSSTVGQGSCFTVTIPLGTVHLPSDRLRRVVGDRIQATRTLTSTALGAAPYVQEAERWIGEDEGDKGEGGDKGDRGKNSSLSSLSPLSSLSLPSPAHVLIVDDNADMRDYLTRILSDRVEVQAVADGAAALAAVNQRVPDLVLSDVMMPGLDGFELLKALRADARTKEVPIILLSARAGEESVIEGLLAGADDYLIKPFSASELVTRVNAYLQLAHLRSETLRSERIINHRKDEVLSTVSHELNTPLPGFLTSSKKSNCMA